MLSRKGRQPGNSATSRGDLAAFDEAFRILRSNLVVAMSDLERPTVIITSAEPDEGKTLTCTNLAMSFAQVGRRVVLVDLDLRNPSSHKLIGAHNEYGVTDVLHGRRSLDDCLQYVDVVGPSGNGQHGLYFLSTGASVSNPTELLALGRTARMLDGLARQADLVLLDTPPVLPVADTLVIGRMAAGAILVVEGRKTSIGAIQKSKDLLIRNQTRLLGVVLNRFQESSAPVGLGYGEIPYGSDHAVKDLGGRPGGGLSANGDRWRLAGEGGTDVRSN